MEDLSNLRTETGVVYFNMFGTDLVVLNSSKVITDLMDKRSAIYSDKVSCHCVPRFIGLGWRDCAFKYSSPATASITNSGADRLRQMGIFGIRVRRQMEDIPSTLP